jgi:hypothetical protein
MLDVPELWSPLRKINTSARRYNLVFSHCGDTDIQGDLPNAELEDPQIATPMRHVTILHNHQEATTNIVEHPVYPTYHSIETTSSGQIF